jgi:putative copper export protein
MGAVLLAAGQQLQLATTLSIVRLSLHVLAATIWVGGQFVILGLLPTVREFGEGAPRKIAQAFGRLSWPAFWLLVATGVWNYLAINHSDASSSWNAVFGIKMLCVLVAGVGTFMHTKATSPKRRGIYAGVGALASIAALVLGVAIAG